MWLNYFECILVKLNPSIKATQTIGNSDKMGTICDTDSADNSDFNEDSLVNFAMFSQKNIIQSLLFTIWWLCVMKFDIQPMDQWI